MALRFLRFFRALAPVLMLASCAKSERFSSAWPESELRGGALRVETVEDFRRALESRTQPHEELWVKAGVIVRRESKSGKDLFTARAMHRAPDRIRLSGSRNPVGTVFDVLIVGKQAHMFFPREGQRFDGTLEELTAKTSAIGGFGPQQLVSAVLVSQELRGRFEAGQAIGAVPKDADRMLLATRDAATRKELFWLVRRADALVEEVLVRSPEGAEELRILYRDYRLHRAEGSELSEPLPERFEILMAREGITVAVDVDEYRLGTPLPSKAFEVPRAREVAPMRLLQFEGSP